MGLDMVDLVYRPDKNLPYDDTLDDLKDRYIRELERRIREIEQQANPFYQPAPPYYVPSPPQTWPPITVWY